MRPDAFYDVSVLPHPKEAIIAAIEGEILREPLNEWVDWLKSGIPFLWNFQRGVGPRPLPFIGEDLGPLPRGLSPENLKRILLEEAHRLGASPIRERAEQLRAIAAKEAELVDARIAAAVRLRETRLRW